MPSPLAGVLARIRLLVGVMVLCGATVLGIGGAPVLAQSVDLGPLRGSVFGSGNRNLVVILHGDGGPNRYAAYAEALAGAAAGTTVVALTRPAFTGATGTSPGQNPQRDHYTPSNNALVAQSLQAMDASLRPGRIIVMGHSGGAAQLATIIATHPGTVDVAILAACPCDVPRWRRHRTGQDNWTASQSPLDVAGAIGRGTRVLAVTLARDGNTLPQFAERYIDAARAAGANATLSVPAGGSHSWSDYQPVVDALIRQNLR